MDFLSPLSDPTDEEVYLPTSVDEEYKPFIRKMAEFVAWHQATRALLLSVLCTFSSAFDVPVFWPILLVYFCTLFMLNMKVRVQHMIKHKYLPFSFGKPVPVSAQML
eukprot:TRINITY_DN5161_c0_g1_i1.p1 TRINITY_DN5161_c0_g1~~TRINITY_DN5161_c0_g1_i1.p1  ORF type:complete len:107 (+),score=15.61 TRINITY_DN5161_c0_g1_i1:496-816(+)